MIRKTETEKGKESGYEDASHHRAGQLRNKGKERMSSADPVRDCMRYRGPASKHRGSVLLLSVPAESMAERESEWSDKRGAQ